ncbi:TIGR02206 family membrane protein [Fusobacterium sp.]|uniref:YwaF family protein n=1 Tax=Fusobacterium sp. TaxID=68766 RepID=UPI00396CD86E
MERFVLFGTQHLIILVSGIIISFVLLILGNILGRKFFGRFTAIIVLIIKIVELYYRHIVYGEKIKELLPLHLCNIALIFVILLMITQSKWLFQPCYFWCLGAVFALITPDVTAPLPNYVTLSFFITHFYILFGMVYACVYYKYRPTLTGYFASFIALNIICLVVYFINRELGTNYLFVNRVPSFKSPLSYFGDWPYYIIVVELIYIVLTYLIYIPLKKKHVKFGVQRF